MASNITDETALVESGSTTSSPSRRLITVEVVVFLYAACFGSIHVLLLPLYIENRVAQEHNITLIKGIADNGTCTNQNRTSNQIEKDISALTSNWIMITTTLSYFPSLIVSPLYGALGDHIGRKIHLLIPCIGEFLYIVFSLAVFYLNLPLSAYACGALFYGFGGGYKCLMTGSFAYISDITNTEKTRLFRIAVVQAVLLGTMSLVQLLSGYSIELFGFIPTTWVCFGLSIAAILYIAIPGCLPESYKIDEKLKHDRKLNLQELLKDVYNLFVQDDKKRNKLLLLFLIYFITDIIQLSQAAAQMFIIYGLGPPFCWSSVHAGYFNFTFLLAGTFGMLIGTRILSRYFSSVSILQIAYGFGLLTYLIAALAPSTAIFTIGAIIGGPRSMDEPVINTLLSTLVSPHEKGVAFAVEASVQSFANFLSPLILNPIYGATVETYPSAVFFVMASGFVFLYVLSWWVFEKER